MVASNLHSPALPYRLLPGGASARRKQITLPQTSLLMRERYKPRVSTCILVLVEMQGRILLKLMHCYTLYFRIKVHPFVNEAKGT